MPTLICVPIMVQDPDSALADAQTAKDHGADLVEFRVDEFFSGDEEQIKAVGKLVTGAPLPCIVTCRAASEGGHYDGDDSARIALFEHLTRSVGKGQHPPRYVDVEFSTYSRSANLRQKIGLAMGVPGGVGGSAADNSATSLILSLHDMTGRPADLLRRVAQMYESPVASIVKVAYRARSLRDSLELLDLASHAQKPTIALGMGEFGVLSRVLSPKFGGFLTFAALRPSGATAPGQPTLSELMHLYRFRDIGAATGVYGVVGYPVVQSLSPLLHNAGFEAHGFDGVYVPLPVAAGEDEESNYLSLKATLMELVQHPTLGLRGCSITAPFKKTVLRLAVDEGWGIDEDAVQIGAANTLHIPGADDGAVSKPVLSNTDAPAASACLEAVLGPLAGKSIGIIGAGGVARAVAFGAAKAGADVHIYARNVERAKDMIAHIATAFPLVGLVASVLEDVGTTTCDALVNCTPVGMKGGTVAAATPLSAEVLRGIASKPVVFDTVYNPVQTPLLIAARDAGLKTIDGVSLFVKQASAQFELWTAHGAPAALFERVVREKLGTP